MDKLKVLLPIDTTEFDKALVDELTNLLQAQSYSLHILHVTAIQDMTWQDYEDVIDDNAGSDVEGDNHNQQAQKLEQHMLEELEPTQLAFKGHGFETTCHIAFGEAPKEIISFATSNNFDLIIMSKHNRKSLPRLNMGSVTTYVLKNATMPVLLLRPLK